MQKKIFIALLGTVMFAGAMVVSVQNHKENTIELITEAKAAVGDPVTCWRAVRFDCVVDGKRYYFFKASDALIEE